MSVSAGQVKQLRDTTGLGMMDCKKLLEESGGDIEKAIELARKQGKKAAEKRASRATGEGRVEAYIHHDGKTGVLVEVNCESDFVGGSDVFRGLCRELCLQVAAARPRHVRREDVPEAVLEKEKEIYREQVKGKPEKIIDKIIEGKLRAFFEDVCLLDQNWVKDDSKTVGELVQEAIAKLGENIVVARFARFTVGETG